MNKTFNLLILSFCLSLHTPHSYATLNVWDVLRNQFTLNHETTQPDVQFQLHWLVSHPNYLQKLTQAEPYIYHIITEIKRRHLPGELALLPMIESAYNPFAYSGVGAAGLWQLMPGTGNELGLKQDWWFDARRSICPSTDAALNYLTHLWKYFDQNWLLAIAAYDSGEGAVTRAIKNSGQSRKIIFWTLPVPNETKAYVPRLLALAEIIKYPQRYRVTLPDIPHVPYFAEVNIGSQIDLNHAAKLAGIAYKDLIKLNPGYNRWTTAPYKPFKLLIPVNKVAYFNRNLASIPIDKRVGLMHYRVQSGDTLGSIAQKYSSTINLIRDLNQLKTNKLTLGQYLLIPSSKNVPATTIAKTPPPIEIDKLPIIQTYKVIHIVQAGDSYPVLEKIYNVTTADIQSWNKISPAKILSIGLQLIIWKRIVQHGIYTVKSGDNLNSIAKSNNTSVQTLAQLNPGIIKAILRPGQKLVLG